MKNFARATTNQGVLGGGVPERTRGNTRCRHIMHVVVMVGLDVELLLLQARPQDTYGNGNSPKLMSTPSRNISLKTIWLGIELERWNKNLST